MIGRGTNFLVNLGFVNAKFLEMDWLFVDIWRCGMRIAGQSPTGLTVQTGRTSSTKGADGFRIELGADGAHQAKAVPASLGIGSLQGLMALQEEVETPLVRRHRAARRGFSLLDTLGTLKAGLLAGVLDQKALSTLQAGLESRREADQDPALRAALDAIEIRTAVELAKLGR